MLCSLPKHERPSLMAIGAAFGADYTTIGRLKRGKTWRHVHD
jgi:hypothetical protein